MPGEGVTHSLHLFRIVPEHFSLRPLMILQPNVIQLCMLAANPKADRIEPLELSPVCHGTWPPGRARQEVPAFPGDRSVVEINDKFISHPLATGPLLGANLCELVTRRVRPTDQCNASVRVNTGPAIF